MRGLELKEIVKVADLLNQRKWQGINKYQELAKMMALVKKEIRFYERSLKEIDVHRTRFGER